MEKGNYRYPYQYYCSFCIWINAGKKRSPYEKGTESGSFDFPRYLCSDLWHHRREDGCCQHGQYADEHSLRPLINTVFYIMAIAVLAGAVSGLLMEFGVVAAINKILSPLMKPLYGLPGASVVGVVTTYLSDNPAILTLAGDDNFKRYFKKYQLPALTNIGTAFGMGMIITTFMIGIKTPSGGSFVTAALIGNLGAIIGSVISARLMLLKTKKLYGTEAPATTKKYRRRYLPRRARHQNRQRRRPIYRVHAGRR